MSMILRLAATLGLFGALVMASLAIKQVYDAAPTAYEALTMQDAASVPKRPWHIGGDKSFCTKSPCLQVEHVADGLVFSLTTYDPNIVNRELRLESKVTFDRTSDSMFLTVEHDPVPAIQDALVANGVDLKELRKPQLLYAVDGSATWQNARIELPYGVLPQFFYDGFEQTANAMGIEVDLDTLSRFSRIATTEVNSRFGLAELASRARVAQIAAGPTQTLTYAAGALAILLVLIELFVPSIRSYSDGVADLIPFTGFFGTLLGVGAGLGVLGLSDVTVDVSKALALGKIGASLGFAINTTICAIIVFGLVVLTQYGVRNLGDVFGLGRSDR